MVNKPVVIVDVDNTLFDYAAELHKELCKVCKDIPTPENWNDWNFYTKYMSKKQFFEAVGRAHERQMDFKPFEDAKEFLVCLSKSYRVCVASHRENRFLDVTKNWLDKYELYYDEVCVLPDKSKLFNKMVKLVVDDSPHIIQEAEKNSIRVCAISYPWNRVMSGNGCIMGNSLSEVYSKLESLDEKEGN
ncbi:MAG: 5' nucleotidase, deoxy (Pyrimidine), cytosolic type C protein (NT5C) [Candidatus Methanofastidiosum methylothiophilum]|uniref:5' nucleotidase, deoxy (Pyrimidine), cytosolic type C protein (NT5C) n=1 Tax=Candidatus Methanofastidiosum methylothiophilum TaxID=1705564 RepID=A0A150IQC0_9EURY|nr:MAG: 5' nucleotidase, deoxy (Pyrimidine), cytosolic type C protein (NT5C) [Candidatus Methanofastidiosum methylthiophilus]